MSLRIILGSSFLALGLVFFGAKYFIEASASTKAKELLIADNAVVTDTKIIEVARQIHSVFKNKKLPKNPPFLWRARPYLTHELLPEFLRFEEGAIDAYFSEGICDSAARTLIFMLNAAGLDAAQLNMVHPHNGGHAVVSVVMEDGREIMIDPYFGIYPMLEGALLSPEQALTHSTTEDTVSEIWMSLTEDSDFRHYRDFGKVRMARQGEPLVIEGRISLAPGETLLLGKINESSRDIRGAGREAGLTDFWTYLGHKYDRGFIRRLTFEQATTVTIHAIETINPRFITTDAEPSLNGNTAKYRVQRGGTLTFHDGRSKRDFVRLRSYQEVDMISFERE